MIKVGKVWIDQNFMHRYQSVWTILIIFESSSLRLSYLIFLILKKTIRRICTQLRFYLSINLPRNSSRNPFHPAHKVINSNFNTIKSRNLVSNRIKKNSGSEIGLPEKTSSISGFLSAIALISLRNLWDVKKRYFIDCQKFCEKEPQTNAEVTIKSSRRNSRTKSTKSVNSWKSSLKEKNQKDLKLKVRR